MWGKRLSVVGLVLAGGTLAAVANAGVSGSIPTHSLGNSHGLNYRVVSYSPFESPDIDLYANCKDPAAVVGGGVSVTGPDRKSNVAYGFPADDSSDVDSVTDDVWVGAAQQRGTPSSLQIKTYSVCLIEGYNRINYEVSTVGIVPDGGTFRKKVACPPGSRVASGGSDTYRGTVSVSAPFDGPDADHAPDDGWKVRGANGEGSSAKLDVWALCLNQPLPLSYAKVGGKVPANGSKTFFATCPDGSSAIGGGYQIAGDPSTHFAHATIPRDSRADSDHVPDDRWQVTAVDRAGERVNTEVTVACLG